MAVAKKILWVCQQSSGPTVWQALYQGQLGRWHLGFEAYLGTVVTYNISHWFWWDEVVKAVVQGQWMTLQHKKKKTHYYNSKDSHTETINRWQCESQSFIFAYIDNKASQSQLDVSWTSVELKALDLLLQIDSRVWGHNIAESYGLPRCFSYLWIWDSCVCVLKKPKFLQQEKNCPPFSLPKIRTWFHVLKLRQVQPTNYMSE